MAKSFLILSSLLLFACSAEEVLEPPQPSARQMKLFQASCGLCHAATNSGAPQIADEEWHKRWAQGFDVLMTNTIEGTEGMPPLGGCNACSYQDLEILVQFLAGRGRRQGAPQ